MYYYEVFEIGRESVKSVNASILTNLIKELVSKYEKNHNSRSHSCKYYIKCKEKLEFTQKKHKRIGDDEGFESDVNEEDSLSGDFSNEDAQSTTSSCCFVEDHVFKSNKIEIIQQNSYERDPTSLVSIIGSIDSANSSGSSDTDELDVHSLTPSPICQSKKQKTSTQNFIIDANSDKKQAKNKKEEYPIADVIFCHTEPKYPTIIAWVIKKPQFDTDYGSRLGVTGVENFTKVENCLEVIVVKCKNSDNLKELCSSYQEYSKRIKLDQYKTIKRKRDEKHISMALSSSISAKDVKVSLSDMKIANSSLIKASELSILNPKIITSFKNDLKNSVSLNSLTKPEQPSYDLGANESLKTTRQTIHTSVKKTQSLMNLSKTWDTKSNSLAQGGNLYQNKSLTARDKFSLIQKTDTNGMTHLEVSKARNTNTVLTEKFPPNKSKLRKEIEGVILTDVESYAKKESIRQRPNPEESESADKTYEAPPIRPERKKYLKKKITNENGVQLEQKISPPQPVTMSPGPFFLTLKPNENPIKEQKVVRGPFVRVQSWGSQNIKDSNLNTWRSEPKQKHVSKYDEKHADRRRSKSAGRIPKKTPMAYRYVDVTNDYRGNPLLKCGMPQKVRDININLTDPMHNPRRRKSFDDIIALDNIKGNLKSVIKKNNKINDKYCEPKKVTFSAFATVQVVD